MASTHLAFDLGAGSGRAVLGTLAGGLLHVDEVHRFRRPLREHGERLTWDLEALWAELRAGYDRARRRAPALASLSVDSWGCDYVPLDRDGVPLRDPYCYRDPRTAGMMARALAEIPRRELYDVTGIQFMEANTLYQVPADRILEPELTGRTATRLMIADYFLHRFGGRAVAERTIVSTSQLLDVMQRLDLAPESWPEIVPPGTPIGGTADGVAVVAGCSHDTAAAVAAVPAAPDGTPWGYVSSGTWSLLGVERAEPLLKDAAFRANFTNEAGAGVPAHAPHARAAGRRAAARAPHRRRRGAQRAALPEDRRRVRLHRRGRPCRGHRDRQSGWCRRAPSAPCRPAPRSATWCAPASRSPPTHRTSRNSLEMIVDLYASERIWPK